MSTVMGRNFLTHEQIINSPNEKKAHLKSRQLINRQEAATQINLANEMSFGVNSMLVPYTLNTIKIEFNIMNTTIASISSVS